jgi:hypothetical protein
MRNTSANYTVIQLTPFPFNGGAQDPVQKPQLFISQRAEIQCRHALLLQYGPICPTVFELVTINPPRRCPGSVAEAQRDDLG